MIAAARAACRDDTDRFIIEGTLAGLTLAVMSDRLGVSRETIRRRRDLIGARLRHPTRRASLST
ncbi:hypothetical protein [Iamia sp.]|uniref:hypothetical protein n=1 Tax=Iamia sp. TaxID=2722710 RepID=UPI002CC27600|nr:hypothetical protein [Iamia sp.]HXH58454.1 hypothetical protein [Iamia sp.]